MKIVKAGMTYFAIIFGVGFVLGTMLSQGRTPPQNMEQMYILCWVL